MMLSPFLRLVESKTQKMPSDLNDRLAPMVNVLATYMFACPVVLNDLLTSFRSDLLPVLAPHQENLPD
jgi:hypothetical protein